MPNKPLYVRDTAIGRATIPDCQLRGLLRFCMMRYRTFFSVRRPKDVIEAARAHYREFYEVCLRVSFIVYDYPLVSTFAEYALERSLPLLAHPNNAPTRTKL